MGINEVLKKENLGKKFAIEGLDERHYLHDCKFVVVQASKECLDLLNYDFKESIADELYLGALLQAKFKEVK